MKSARHSSSLLFYFVAGSLGLSFLATLLVLSWNSVIESEARDFAFDTISIQNSLEARIRTADAVIDNLASFVDANSALSSAVFAAYTRGTLERYAFVQSLAHVRLDAAAGTVELLHAAGSLPSEALEGVLAEEQNRRILRQSIGVGSSAIPLVGESSTGGPRRLFFVRSTAATSNASGLLHLVILVTDPTHLVDLVAVDPAIELALYTESEGVAGRRLVFLRSPQGLPSGPTVETLEKDSVVRLPRFSLRMTATKGLFWSELDKNLVFAALVLGLGVTLLMVALARAKDLQSRELQARNRVIEEQVEQQTRDLAIARDQALEASRVKSDFLASMSHEIRTPLNAIIGMAELLAETRLDDEQDKYVGVFRNAGEALLSLVNDILDLSKIEAEQVTLERIEFDLVELVEQAVEINALKADAKGLELVADIYPEVPDSVVGDPGRVRQIMLNLVGNAIKFTESGQVVVRITHAGDGGDDTLLHFEVADSGIGIPEDKLESIFSTFTQVDTSTTRKYGGTGLGLAICRRLAELMGGRIWAESGGARGSRFHVELDLPPVAHSSAQEKQRPVPTATPTPLGRVLIVDGNLAVAEAVARILGSAGRTTAIAHDMQGALQALDEAAHSERPYALIILGDLIGDEQTDARIARLREVAAGLPVICLFRPSAMAREVEAIRNLPATTYVVKPVRRGQLLGALAASTVGRRSSRPGVPAVAVDTARQARLLLVEDNPDNRLLIRAYLKQSPYEVVEAENGAVAFDKFKSEHFDLVLMDIQMPVMDGYAATAAIREWERQQGRAPTTLIALTASAVKEDIERSLATGCDAHLTKPIKKQILLDALRSHLDAVAP